VYERAGWLMTITAAIATRAIRTPGILRRGEITIMASHPRGEQMAVGLADNHGERDERCDGEHVRGAEAQTTVEEHAASDDRGEGEAREEGALPTAGLAPHTGLVDAAPVLVGVLERLAQELRDHDDCIRRVPRHPTPRGDERQPIVLTLPVHRVELRR